MVLWKHGSGSGCRLISSFFSYIFPSQVFWEMGILVTWAGNCFKISSLYPAKLVVVLHGWI
uniref:Uncharacterized protein n=1 Tax=Solanum tuberosum TaxID=4113 RepID=M1CAN2_SOLTU